MSSEPATPLCPRCRRPLPETAPSRPFCSERCRLADLGAWFGGEYAVPAATLAATPAATPDSDPAD